MNELKRPYRIVDSDLIPQHASLLVQDPGCGAIARSPIEMTRSSVQSCSNVVPLFVVFQIPDAAPAT